MAKGFRSILIFPGYAHWQLERLTDNTLFIIQK